MTPNILDILGFSAFADDIINNLKSKKTISFVERKNDLIETKEQAQALEDEILTYLFNYQVSNPSKFINIYFEIRVLNALLERRAIKLSCTLTFRIMKVRKMLLSALDGFCSLDEAFSELNSLNATLRRRDRQIRRINYLNQGDNPIIETRTIRNQLLNQMYVKYAVSSILEGDSIDESLLETITDALKGYKGNAKYAIFLLTVLHYASSSSDKFSKWKQEVTDRRYQAFLVKDDSFAYRKAVMEIEDLFFSYIPPIRVIKDIVKNIKTYFN